MKKDEIGRTCGMQGREGIYIYIYIYMLLVKTPEKEEHLADLSVVGKRY
jgi:hypothetical protein